MYMSVKTCFMQKGHVLQNLFPVGFSLISDSERVQVYILLCGLKALHSLSNIVCFAEFFIFRIFHSINVKMTVRGNSMLLLERQ